ncbi:hypothetical protein FRC09_007626, partial [Ceratobasidium sp. 395]
MPETVIAIVSFIDFANRAEIISRLLLKPGFRHSIQMPLTPGPLNSRPAAQKLGAVGATAQVRPFFVV